MNSRALAIHLLGTLDNVHFAWQPASGEAGDDVFGRLHRKVALVAKVLVRLAALGAWAALVHTVVRNGLSFAGQKAKFLLGHRPRLAVRGDAGVSMRSTKLQRG